MLKVISLYTLLIIINFLITKQKTCGKYEVPNCKTCDDVKEKCIECKSGLFPTYAGLECSSCNDESIGGQMACEGSCDSSKISISGRVLCDKCKTGYYSIEGICTLCSSGSPNCKRCSYEASPGSTQKIYTCLECVNNEYDISDVDGICYHWNLPPHCLKCIYPPGSHTSGCVLCESGYYPDNGLCYECNNQLNIITGGGCYYYYCPGTSDHNRLDHCYCNSSYALTPQNTCLSCPPNCEQCIYEGGIVKCINYNCKYALSPQNTCTHCPNNCEYCYYDQNILKCSLCETRYRLLNYQCSSCGDHFSSCYSDQNILKCYSCDTRYGLLNYQCSYCGDHYLSCYSDQNILKCHSCDTRYGLLNYQCSYCGDHCLSCHFSNNNTAICTRCGDGYILTDKQICENLSIPAHCNSYQNKRFNNRDEVICNSFLLLLLYIKFDR